MKDYYKILEIERTASAADIKDAYYRLVRKYHPDLNLTNFDSTEKFQEITEAYNILGDLDKRLRYCSIYDKKYNLYADIKVAHNYQKKKM